MIIVFLVSVISCENSNTKKNVIKSNNIDLIVAAYKDSISKSKNEAYKNEYDNNFREAILNELKSSKRIKWKGIYKESKVSGSIIQYKIHFNKFHINDFASKNTDTSKYEIVKELINGDSVEVSITPKNVDNIYIPSINFKLSSNKVSFNLKSDSIRKL